MGETPALIKLVAELLLVIQGYTGYVVPAEQPELRFMDGPRLQQIACQRPCAVYGWFPPGKVVYLHEALDPLNNPAARGILLHELVHFLQQENDAFAEDDDCHRWMHRESEAFDVQIRWLTEMRAPLGSLLRDRRLPLRVHCPPAEKAETGLGG